MSALNFMQRDALLQAQARRIKAARLARIQAMERAAAAPDYFTWQAERLAFRAYARRVYAAVQREWSGHPFLNQRGCLQPR